MDSIKEAGRIIAGAYYDYQEVRVSSMNRIRDVIRKKNEGIEFDQVEEKKEEKKFDRKYNDKMLVKTLEKMHKEGKISEKEFEYLSKSLELAKASDKLEAKYKVLMMGYIEGEPIWKAYLSHVRGLGPVLSANLIKSFGDCSKYEHISSLWKHCGLHVVDGSAPKRKRGEKIDYNPKLRTMMWKIGDSFIKQNSPVFRQIYDSEKAKQMARTDENKPKSKMHGHLRAMRKMVKIFLSTYWVASRELAKLPVSLPFVEEKLGHTGIITWQEVVDANEAAKSKPRSKSKIKVSK